MSLCSTRTNLEVLEGDGRGSSFGVVIVWGSGGGQHHFPLLPMLHHPRLHQSLQSAGGHDAVTIFDETLEVRVSWVCVNFRTSI